MPVSPQDFALWSRMTGNPIPVTPADQMAAAPQVYNFVQNYSRGRDPFRQAGEGISQFIDTAGKAALTAGLLTGASLLAAKYVPRGAKTDAPATEKSPLDWMKSTETSSSGGSSYIPTEISVPASKLAAPASKPAYRGIRGQIPYEAGELIPGQSESIGQITGQEGKTMPEATTPGTMEDLVAQAQEHTEGYYEKGSSPEQAAMSELAKQKRTAERATIQEAIGMFDPGQFLGKYTEKLQLDDEPQVDNDVVAAEPLSTVGRVSKDVTAADPASDINQRVLPAQTQQRVEAARVEPQPTTVAENLATKQSPVHAAPEFVGRFEREARQARRAAEEQKLGDFFRRALGLQTAQQRKELAAQVSGTAEQPAAEAKAIQVAPIAREVKTASFSTNPYLSPMSQAEGSLQTYEIDPSRSRAISEMTFYPGGELGVEMQTKSGPKEYVYAMKDPYREALGEYAAQGFPSGMGQIGRIATTKATGVQTDVQLPVKKGGILSGGEANVPFKMTPEARELDEALSARAAARERSGERVQGETFAGSPAAEFLRSKAISAIERLAKSPVN